MGRTGDTGDGLTSREIGDVDEGVVEGGEDAGNAEDKLAWRGRSAIANYEFVVSCQLVKRRGAPSATRIDQSETYHREPGGPGRCSPAQDERSSWGPS